MERLPMHKIREILRLRWVLGLGVRQAAASADVGRSVVSKPATRAERAGLDRAAVEKLSDNSGRPDQQKPGGAERHDARDVHDGPAGVLRRYQGSTGRGRKEKSLSAVGARLSRCRRSQRSCRRYTRG